MALTLGPRLKMTLPGVMSNTGKDDTNLRWSGFNALLTDCTTTEGAVIRTWLVPALRCSCYLFAYRMVVSVDPSAARELAS